jgi:uncharacterized protein with PIN domain
MKFAVDCMLGKLAKWLRILGFDAVFFPAIADDELLHLALKEGRVLLTRDTALLERARAIDTLFITNDDWRLQLQQVLDGKNLRSRCRPYSRCLECNVGLKPISKARARNLVTPFVYETAEDFSLCPECGRVFWKGSHHEDMQRMIEQILRKK